MENKYLLTYSDSNGNSFAWFDSLDENEIIFDAIRR